MKRFFFILLVSFLFNNEISISNHISFGYDSNPMKLSSDEIENSENNIFMSKYNIASKYLKINSKLQTSVQIFKRKTRLSFAIKKNLYIDLDEKSNYGIYFKFNQPLGKYRYLKFDYTFIPDIFLREYDDGDYIYQYFNFIGDISYQCYFNLSKLSIKYQIPILDKNNKVTFVINNETQYYNENFTEFDLEINGAKILFNKKLSNANFSVSYEYSIADNITLFDGSTSTSLMDRGYDEGKMRLSYSRTFRDFSIGGSLYNINRQYSSTIMEDDLHLNRRHTDKTFSVWFKFKVNKLSHKFIFSNRDRVTSSPESWVQNLKTFNRYDISYTVFFKKISFRK